MSSRKILTILTDLNKYYFDPNYNPQDFINRSKINNIFISVGRILMSFIKYPVQDIKNFRGLPDKGKTWVFTATSRHYMSVYGLESHVENLIFLNWIKLIFHKVLWLTLPADLQHMV